MCGIFGGAKQLLIEKPISVLNHRGPDSSGSYHFSPEREPSIIGQTQLRIVSPDRITLPYEHNGSHIVMNGQIYNWKEIKKDLITYGYTFQYNSDIEVALKAYQHWGVKCLDHFNGMFAIAIWDGLQFFLARDRLGKKPLFYKTKNGVFAFSSEIKVFSHLEFNRNSLCERLGFYFDKITPYKDIYSVLPGHYLIYDTKHKTEVSTKWWEFPEEQGEIVKEEEAVEELIFLLNDAIRIRQPDKFTKTTIFLSGGIDSSLLQILAQFDETFTIQFEEFRKMINEEQLVKKLSLSQGFKANIIIPTVYDLQKHLRTIAWHLEMPVGSLSPLPLFMLSKAASNSGYRVAFSGDGADELFNGYFRNELMLQEDKNLQEGRRGSYGPLLGQYYGSQLSRFCRMMSRGDTSLERKLKPRFKLTWNSSNSFSYNIARAESSVFLQPLIAMADRMSMAHSVEVRSPFLDYRVVEFSTRLSPILKYQDKRGKYIVRQALKRVAGSRANDLLARPEKHGLPAPIGQWMKSQSIMERTNWNRQILDRCLDALQVRIINEEQ